MIFPKIKGEEKTLGKGFKVFDDEKNIKKIEWNSKEKIIEIKSLIEKKFKISIKGNVIAVSDYFDGNYQILFKGIPEITQLDLSDCFVDKLCLSMFSIKFNTNNLTYRKKVYYFNHDFKLRKNKKQVRAFGKYLDTGEITYYIKPDNALSDMDIFGNRKEIGFIGLDEKLNGETEIKLY